MSVVSYTIA